MSNHTIPLVLDHIISLVLDHIKRIQCTCLFSILTQSLCCHHVRRIRISMASIAVTDNDKLIYSLVTYLMTCLVFVPVFVFLECLSLYSLSVCKHCFTLGLTPSLRLLSRHTCRSLFFKYKCWNFFQYIQYISYLITHHISWGRHLQMIWCQRNSWSRSTLSSQ